jgi:carbon-monoxide dehydrogenase small subunit
VAPILRFAVNGVTREVPEDPRLLLAEHLRDLGLLSVHIGCRTGNCGACTVLLDGEPVKSCCVLACDCDGVHVTTVEGLREDALFRRIVAAFVEHHAAQCGFCSPAMALSVYWLIRRGGGALELADELHGNLCRCTGYGNIREAVTAVRAEADGGAAAPRLDR